MAGSLRRFSSGRTRRATIDFVAGTPATVVSDRRRREAGLDAWVDGTMGFVRDGATTTVISPNGPMLARHICKPGDDLISGLVAPAERIEGLPPSVAHAAGGPVLRVAERDLLVLVYHGETFTAGDPADYYAFLGLAVSHKGGPFKDLGVIISSDQAELDPSRVRPVDVGPGGYVIRDGWFHVFFQDRGIGVVRRNLSVARARLDDVVAHAAAGSPPTFRKWSGTDWDEPGVGGCSAELLHHEGLPVLWSDAAYVEQLGSFLVVFSTVVRGRRGRWLWNQAAVLSEDALNWTAPVLLMDRSSAAEMLYVTIDSGGVDQRTVCGDTFDIYRTCASPDNRWDQARLERVAISIRPTGR